MLIRRNALPVIRLLFLITLTAVATLAAQQRPSPVKKADSSRSASPALLPPRLNDSISVVGDLNQEERSFRLADRLPISYLQRGRFASLSILGMPPGFLEYRYGNNRLQNHATGVWNEQWLPIYQITRWDPRDYPYQLATDAPRPVKKKPESRIIYSQDYVIGLNYLDLNFRRNTSPTNFIQLSGSNFLGRGSEEQDYSNFQVNTYRAQYHRQFGKSWQSDWYYWQMRHTFKLAPVLGTRRDKQKQIGHIAWVHLRGRVGENDSLSFTPGVDLIRDRYFRGIDRLRKSRYLDYHAELTYLHNIKAWKIGGRAYGSLFEHRAEALWVERKESELRGDVLLQKDSGRVFVDGEIGVRYHSESDREAALKLDAGIRFGRDHRVSVRVFRQPKIIPMLWRTLINAPFPAYPESHFILRRGAMGEIRLNFSGNDQFRLQPFWVSAENVPRLRADSLGWEQADVENYGLRVQFRKKIWQFIIENDLTLSGKGGEIFVPEINNVASLRTGQFFFKRALKVEGILNWRYLGDYRTVSLERLLYLYQLTNQPNGNYHLIDARVQAHVHNAVLFFSWDNLLSKDYSIIDNTIENYIVFRLGIDWFFYD